MLFFTTLFLFDTSLFAQKPPQNRGKEIIPDETEQFLTRHNMRVNVESGIPVSAYELSYKVNPDSPQKMAEQFLRENHSMLHLRSDLSDLKYTNTIETPGGYHVHFTQYMDDYPVYKSTLNVTISRNSRVVFVMNGYKTSYGSKNQINIQSPGFLKMMLCLPQKITWELIRI